MWRESGGGRGGERERKTVDRVRGTGGEREATPAGGKGDVGCGWGEGG